MFASNNVNQLLHPMRLTTEERAVLNQDYAKGEVVRAETARYQLIHRGSIRLVRDLFRTETEQREFIAAGLRLKLPGQR